MKYWFYVVPEKNPLIGNASVDTCIREYTIATVCTTFIFRKTAFARLKRERRAMQRNLDNIYLHFDPEVCNRPVELSVAPSVEHMCFHLQTWLRIEFN